MGIPTEDLPPSYAESITTTTTTTATSTSLTSPVTNPTTGLPSASPLTTHLRTLPARLRATHLARQTAQASRDLTLTDLLLPHVEEFLADLTSPSSSTSVSTSKIPPVAELTLVPSSAVPDGSAMVGVVERRKEGEDVRVARVGVGKLEVELGDNEKGTADEYGRTSSLRAGEAGFDEWGRFETDDGSAAGRESGWWFTDEGMARRLAGYLRPEPNLERKQVQAAVVEKKVAEKEKSGWGRWGIGGSKKKSADLTSPVGTSPVSPALSSPGAGGQDGSVKMTVRAEEVTFRKENEFGLWESRTGWGIVVSIRVKP